MKRKPYLTLLLIAAIVYFFLAIVWRYFAPLFVSFLILLLVEPSLEKCSCRMHMKKRVIAYLIIMVLLLSMAAGIWFGLIPYLKCCDFSWCLKMLEHPWVKRILEYLQTKGLDSVSGLPTLVLSAASSFLFQAGAYGLSLFLLSNVYCKLKKQLEEQPEGQLLLEICGDIISYLKGYIKTQSKLLVIILVICSVGLTVIGIRFGWLLGIFAAIMDFFPVFGTGIVLVPTALWQFLEGDYGQGILCLILFLICGIVREILEPKFLGNALRLPAIGIWISIYAGIQLFGFSGFLKGPIGYLLIVTVYARVRQAQEASEEKQ